MGHNGEAAPRVCVPASLRATTAVCYVLSLKLKLSQDKHSSALITFPLLFASSEKDVSIGEPQLGQCRDVLTLKCSVTTRAVFPPIS